MEKYLVSVIIPTYNRGYCIKASIESVLNQTYSNIECIVVDDGSKDDTKRIVESISDNRVRYVYLSDNKGASHARNIGIKYAKGDYIAFNDSDDVWYPCKLEEQMSKFYNEENIGLVYCDYMYKGDNTEFIMPHDIYDMSELEGNIFQSLLNDNKIGTPVMVIKKKCIKEIGGFNEELKSLEDWEFALRIAEKYTIGYVHKTLMQAHYSMNGVNSNIEAQINTFLYIIKKYMGKGYSLRSIKKNFFDKLIMIKNTQYIEKIKQQALRVVTEDAEEFDCMMDLTITVSKLQKTNRILTYIANSDLLYRYASSYIDMNNDLVAVYGAGNIGKTVAYCLSKLGIKIVCLIDKNKKDSFIYDIIKPEELRDDITVVVSTILSEDIEAIQTLLSREIKIINIFDIYEC